MTQRRRRRSIRLVSRSRSRSFTSSRHGSRRSEKTRHWTKHHSKLDFDVRHNRRHSRSSKHHLQHVRLQNTDLKEQVHLMELDKRSMEKEIARLHTLLRHGNRGQDKIGMDNKSYKECQKGTPPTFCKDHMKLVALIDNLVESCTPSKPESNIATRDRSKFAQRDCTWWQPIHKKSITDLVKKSPITGRDANDESDNMKDLQLHSDDLLTKQPHQCATDSYIESEFTYADSELDQQHMQHFQAPRGIYVDQSLRQEDTLISSCPS